MSMAMRLLLALGLLLPATSTPARAGDPAEIVAFPGQLLNLPVWLTNESDSVRHLCTIWDASRSWPRFSSTQSTYDVAPHDSILLTLALWVPDSASSGANHILLRDGFDTTAVDTLASLEVRQWVSVRERQARNGAIRIVWDWNGPGPVPSGLQVVRDDARDPELRPVSFTVGGSSIEASDTDVEADREYRFACSVPASIGPVLAGQVELGWRTEGDIGLRWLRRPHRDGQAVVATVVVAQRCDVEVELFGVDGRRIRSARFTGVAGAVDLRFEAPELAPSVVLCSVRSPLGRLAHKLALRR